MIKTDFFYSIARYNERLTSKREFYPLLEHVLYGNNENAIKILDIINKKTQISGGDATYKIFRIEFKET